MTDRDTIKKEIDRLPDDRLDEVYEFVLTLNQEKTNGKRIRTFHLEGRFDDVDVRKRAYE